MKENNKVFLSGEIVEEKVFSHEVYGERFYESKIAVERLSGQKDIIPIMISNRLIDDNFNVGDRLSIIGQFRSYNKQTEGRSKLLLTVFVREIVENISNQNPNSIVLNGYVCKEPTFRTTPFNREIADILIAVNRSYNKSDYIPCICWGRNARFVKNLAVGEKIVIAGRVQSRDYQKKYSEDDIRTMTAYEVSICKLAAYDNIDNFDMDKEFEKCLDTSQDINKDDINNLKVV